MKTGAISLLYPSNLEIDFNELTMESVHDLGMDAVIRELSIKETEQNLILGIMSKITNNVEVAKYRMEAFDDIYNNKKMRDDLVEILDKINFLKDYGSFGRKYTDGPSVWDLLHRLEEINDYILCVEAMYDTLQNADIHSQALHNLQLYIKELYENQAFDALKKDISNCRATTQNLRSVTVGINLNSQFEASEIGVISINSKPFTKSNIISSFHDKLSFNDNISGTSDWEENYKFQPFSNATGSSSKLEKLGKLNTIMAHPLLMSSLASVPSGDSAENVTFYMESITNHMLALTAKKLRSVLAQYVNITITDITNLIPEFIYYIRWAEYIEKLRQKGAVFSKASVIEGMKQSMVAKGVYNIKLAAFASKEHENIITNDLDFDDTNTVYILTGANRGGKTTITQCIGQLFMMAQGGIFVPADSFSFLPVDNIFTHFPADEDKTMDLGRLGEECKRFKQMYSSATKDSLMLLNETFSTTSFEEGYYIAKDSVKAILAKEVRTIYNTHMHKLAFDIEELNSEGFGVKAASLIVKSDGGNRSYKIEIAKPVGQSYASDIARKYGVTFEMLVE